MSFTLSGVKAPKPMRRRIELLDHPPSSFARWRAFVGMRQDEAAAFFGVTRQTISAWDAGKTKPGKSARIRMRQRVEPGLDTPWPE